MASGSALIRISISQAFWSSFIISDGPFTRHKLIDNHTTSLHISQSPCHRNHIGTTLYLRRIFYEWSFQEAASNRSRAAPGLDAIQTAPVMLIRTPAKSLEAFSRDMLGHYLLLGYYEP